MFPKKHLEIKTIVGGNIHSLAINGLKIIFT